MRAEDRADLGHELGLAVEDLAALLDEVAGRLGVLDVLDDPGVGAVGVALAGVLDQALEGAAPGPHALDRRDLLLERQDRLDLQRRAEQRLGRADPAAPPQELERVDREPDLDSVARLRHALDDGVGAAAVGGDARAGERDEPLPAGAPCGCRRS